MLTTTTMGPKAQQWGALWGNRPRDWAVSEEQQAPVYEATLEHLGIRPDDRLLDVGCGTGVFLRMAADRGAIVSGLDASEGLLEVARERVPEAELCLGDMQSLPYGDDRFDVVTGFTSFFFAEDMVEALREAGRVTRPGGRVAIEVFGNPDNCDLEAMKAAVARFRTPAQGEHAENYWRPGIVEELAIAAGLEVERSFDTTSVYEYANDSALTTAMAAAGGAAVVAGPDREHELRAAILEELAHCRQGDGSYRVSNEWHVVIARA